MKAVKFKIKTTESKDKGLQWKAEIQPENPEEITIKLTKPKGKERK